ncbi:MAG TPA: CapA family protein, partial [Polyangiaceae bacterium]|nr:CapA family protein [Polyangiaceae bacterium]
LFMKFHTLGRADLVLGHHSHTPQRVEFHKQIPVVMSLGNFVFHQHRDHPWTGWSYLARVTFPPKGPLTIEACPFFIFDASPQPLTQAQQTAYFQHWDAISRAPRAAIRGARSADGCVALLSP